MSCYQGGGKKAFLHDRGSKIGWLQEMGDIMEKNKPETFEMRVIRLLLKQFFRRVDSIENSSRSMINKK